MPEWPGRIARLSRRAEVRAHPITAASRRLYFEAVRRAAPPVLRRPHRSRLLGTPFRVRAPIDESVGRSLFLFGVYEPVASRLFARLLRPGDVAVDVGAHYGDYCLLAAHTVGARGVVYAFEPQSDIRGLLESNLAANKVTNTRVLPFALADSDGHANLYHHVEPTYTGGASLLRGQAGQAGDYESVDVRRLDSVVDRADMGRVAAVKIDVEGAEADVLRGAAAVLGASRPAVIFEVNGLVDAAGGPTCAAFDVLAHAGYDLYGMVDKGRRQAGLVRLEPGADPLPYREPWLALNLLALHPDSAARMRVADLMS